jgi:hypothetical protein
MIKEEIIRIRELMNLSEAAPGVGDDLAKKFAQTLAPLFKKIATDYTDDELEVLLKKNAKNIDEVKEIIKLIRDTPAQQLLNKIPAADLLKLVDATDMAKFADQAADRTNFEQFFVNNAAEWKGLDEEALKKEYKKFQEQSYDLIVNKGLGQFPEGVPPQAKEYFEKYYENVINRFKVWMENQRPGFNRAVKGITDWQDYILSRTWDNIEPLTDAQLRALAKNKKEGFFEGWREIQTQIKDYFASKTQISEELMTLVKQVGQNGEFPKDVEDRLSDLMEVLQKKDKQFYTLLNNWIDVNIVGASTLKNKLKSLPGFVRAKALSDGDTRKAIDTDLKTYSQRQRLLRQQFYDVITLWGKNWDAKFGEESSKWRTLWNSDSFKQLRASAFLPGTTLSLSDWGRIIKDLGLNAAVVKGGKEVAYTWLYWTFVISTLETLYDSIMSGASTLWPANNWLKSQAFDEEGNPEFKDVDFFESPEYAGLDRALSIFTTFADNFLENTKYYNGGVPGWADDVAFRVRDLIYGIAKAGNLTTEEREKIKTDVENSLKQAQDKKEELERGENTGTEESSKNRLLIPNDLERAFKAFGGKYSSLTKNIVRKGINKFEYNFPNEKHELVKGKDGIWYLDYKGKVYSLNEEGTLINIQAASE